MCLAAAFGPLAENIRECNVGLFWEIFAGGGAVTEVFLDEGGFVLLLLMSFIAPILIFLTHFDGL